jgi:hypothetical protein
MPEGSIPMANLKKEQAGAVAFDARWHSGRGEETAPVKQRNYRLTS